MFPMVEAWKHVLLLPHIYTPPVSCYRYYHSPVTCTWAWLNFHPLQPYLPPIPVRKNHPTPYLISILCSPLLFQYFIKISVIYVYDIFNQIQLHSFKIYLLPHTSYTYIKGLYISKLLLETSPNNHIIYFPSELPTSMFSGESVNGNWIAEKCKKNSLPRRAVLSSLLCLNNNSFVGCFLPTVVWQLQVPRKRKR